MPCETTFRSMPLMVVVGVAIMVAVAVAVYCALGGVGFASHATVKLHVYAPNTADAQLVVAARIGGRDVLMQLDTGFSGPPTLHAAFLGCDSGSGSVLDRYGHCLARPNGGEHALTEFAQQAQCTAYAGGCSTTVHTATRAAVEDHARLWQCGCIQLQSTDGYVCVRRKAADVILAKADVVAPHILTVDYMLDVAPSVLWMREEKWELCRGVRAAWLRSVFRLERLELHSGVPVIKVLIGGRVRRLILDTGAGFAVLLSDADGVTLSGRRVGLQSIHKHATEAEVGTAQVHVASTTFDNVPVLVGAAISGVDGLIGLGLLRCLDIYIGRKHIGMRSNGNPALAA